MYVNGQKLKTVTINTAAGTNTFYVDTTEIPEEYLTEESDTITVKFQAIPGKNSYVGGLFGISTSSSTAYDTDASLAALSFDKGTMTPAYDKDTTEYVLEVPEDTETVAMTATPKKESGLVYVGDVLIDDKHPRNITLTGEETVVNLTSKAQDHETEQAYKITIKKVKKTEQEIAIVTDPSDYKGIVGETAEFTVEATGEGLTYQWEYCNAGSAKWRTSSMEGSTEATIKVPVGTWRDGQKYRCVVKDEAGNTVTSKEAVMTVGKADTAPVITAQPESVTRNKGETAEFTVEATGEGLTYQWEYCNAGSDKWRTSSMEGNQTETIKVAAGSWRNGQKYRCVITGADGRIVVSEAAVLTVK